MIGEVRTLDGIISEFLEYARPATRSPVPFDAAGLAEGAAFLLGPEMEQAGVHFVRDIADGLRIHADPDKVKRALVNLMKNGIQAMPNGGTLTVSAAGGEDRVSVVVADSGTGIGDVAMERLFEPFYTTREKGSGLGLAIVRKIAEDNDGLVVVESEPGEGSRFRMELPRGKQDA